MKYILITFYSHCAQLFFLFGKLLSKDGKSYVPSSRYVLENFSDQYCTDRKYAYKTFPNLINFQYLKENFNVKYGYVMFD